MTTATQAPDTVKIMAKLKQSAPIANAIFSVRRQHLSRQIPIRNKDGEIERDEKGAPKTQPVFEMRAIDIPKLETFYAGNEDQVGAPKPGKVHAMTRAEYEWLLREIGCFVVRFKDRPTIESKGIGPNKSYARCDVVRTKRQDPTRPGEFLADVRYYPEHGGDIGGRILALDVPMSEFIEIRAATQEDERPTYAMPSNGGIVDWDALRAAKIKDEDKDAVIADLKAALAAREREEETAHEEEEKSQTRRGRRRRS